MKKKLQKKTLDFFAILSIVLSAIIVYQNWEVENIRTNLTIKRFNVPTTQEQTLPLDQQEASRAKQQGKEGFETFSDGGLFFFIVRQFDFAFDGATGTISHACTGPLKLSYGPTDVDPYHDAVCTGENLLFMDFGGKRTTIAQFNPKTFSELKKLNDVTLVTPDGPLLISFSEDYCDRNEGLCFQEKQITHRVTLPDAVVHPLSTKLVAFASFNQFIWNSDGTKGVMESGCPEGCPTEEYVGVNLLNGKTTILTKRDDHSLSPADVSWLDTDTVLIRGKSYSF